MLNWLRRIVARFERRWIRDDDERERHGSLVRSRLGDGPVTAAAPTDAPDDGGEDGGEDGARRPVRNDIPS